MAEEPPSSRSPLLAISNRPQHVVSRPIAATSRKVTFLHPAYKEDAPLLEIPAFDHERGGLHYATALLLCGIIAGNVWNGWLTGTPSGPELRLEDDALLTGERYFFHVPWPENTDGDGAGSKSQPYKYPIVLSFQNWPFPHDNPPPGWSFDQNGSDLPTPSLVSSSSASQAIKFRDVYCRVSGYQDEIERAHLCPRTHSDWFIRQRMDRYNANPLLIGASLVDDLSNSLALRQDIHSCFDKGSFIFTRKQQTWVAHFLAPTRNLGPTYHNTKVEIPTAVHQAFLLARIGWAVLPMTQNFLLRGAKRLVSLASESSESREVQELGREELQIRLNRNSRRGRSKSPQKRPREEDNAGDVGDSLAAVSKRPCLNISKCNPPILTSSQSPSTPDLVDVKTNSIDSRPEHLMSHSSTDNEEEDDERHRITSLRKKAIRMQRKVPSELVCCDYNAAELAVAAGIEGPKEFGGAHLCLQCLGAEIRDD